MRKFARQPTRSNPSCQNTYFQCHSADETASMPGSLDAGSASIKAGGQRPPDAPRAARSLEEVEVVTSTDPAAPANEEISRDVVAGWEREADATRPPLKCGLSSWSAFVATYADLDAPSGSQRAEGKVKLSCDVMINGENLSLIHI